MNKHNLKANIAARWPMVAWLIVFAAMLGLTACRQDGAALASGPQATTPSGAPAMSGSIYGGRQPVAGATVVAYAAGLNPGDPAVELGSAISDAAGNFSISVSSMPANGQIVYFIAMGGDAGAGVANSAIGLMTVAGGYCDPSVTGCTFPALLNIDELTTVAATAVLQKYIAFVDCTTIGGNDQSGTCVAIAGKTGLDTRAATVRNLVDPSRGQAAAFLTEQPSDSPIHTTLEKLNTLADVLAGCVNSSGPDSTACSSLLFNVAVSAPDTLQASFRVAAYKGVNAKGSEIFGLLPPNPVYSPVLAAAPADTADAWTLSGRHYAYVANANDDSVSGYRRLDVTVSALTDLGSWGSGNAPKAIGVDPGGRYIYVPNSGGNTLTPYTIGSDGSLTAGTNINTGSKPIGVAVDPTGQFVYVANSGGDSVSGYTIGPGGVLTAMANSPFPAGSSPNGLAIDPTGSFLYVTNNGGNDVSAYRIDTATATAGQLLPVTASPCGGAPSVDPGNCFAAGSGPSGVAAAPSGGFLYVTNQTGNNISAYSIDGTSGALSDVSGSACGSGLPGNCFASGTTPVAIAIDPGSQFVYVIDGCTHCVGNISAYTIGSGGVLVDLGGSSCGAGLPSNCFATGNDPQSITVDLSGEFLYVTNSQDDTVSTYEIDGTTGAPGEVSGSPFSTGKSPLAVAVDPTGRHLYVVVNNGNVYGYSIGNAHPMGPVLNSPFSAGAVGSAPAFLAVAPRGRFLFVANKSGNSVAAFAIDPATGTLVETAVSPAVSGNAPVSLATDPAGKYLYVANSGDGTVSAFSVDGGTGALTALTSSPVAAGSTPVSVAVDPAGNFVYVVDAGDATVTTYQRDTSTGALTEISAGSPFSVSASPNTIAMDPAGLFAYLGAQPAGSNGDVSVMSVNAGTGALGAIANYTIAPSNDPVSIAVDPAGDFLYVANSGSNDILTYQINPADGTLTAVGTAVAAGAKPSQLAINPNGRLLYVTNRGENSVSVYAIDSSTGSLAPAGNSPFSTGGAPSSISISP